MTHVYRVFAPLRAVREGSAGFEIITLPAGAVLRPIDQISEAGMINVMYNGDNIRLFAEDLRERGNLIAAQASA